MRVKPISSQDNVHAFEYYPLSTGKYSVSITWGGQHIPKRSVCVSSVCLYVYASQCVLVYVCACMNKIEQGIKRECVHMF